MGLRRIGIHQLRVGTPLPFDAYDAEGKLLLVRGFVIESQDQLERLVERGLFSDFIARGVSDELLEDNEPVPSSALHAGRRVSVFEDIAALRRRLDEALQAPPPAGFAGEIEAIAGGVAAACAVDGDAALAAILVARQERYPVRQAMNVAVLSEILLHQLEQPEQTRRETVCAALTMNIAIMDLQDTLYRQATQPDEAQRRRLWLHPSDGEARLRALGVAAPEWLRAVREHHEGMDGSGYPGKLLGDTIGLPARVITLADRYCAMVSERANRPGTLPNLALREIFLRQGKAVDPHLIGLLVKEVSVYPPGTAVQLASGETGVVVKRTLNASHPVVKVIRDARGKVVAEFHKRLTSKDTYAVTGVLPAQELSGHIDCEKLWPPSRVE